jgi:threonine/homoserine/homoserine lactone efflux protein
VHDLGVPLSAFGLGAALGALPGPVQFLLLTESSRGGVGRGFSAMAGANGTFAVLLLGLAGGVSALTPGKAVLRTLEIVGGAFLLWIAWDAVREAVRGVPSEGAPPARLGAPVRGILAVLLNPGAWIFLATSASAVMAEATGRGGRGLAFVTALAMLAGVAAIDGTMVLLGGGARRFGTGPTAWVTRAFAVGLACFGAILVFRGIRG